MANSGSVATQCLRKTRGFVSNRKSPGSAGTMRTSLTNTSKASAMTRREKVGCMAGLPTCYIGGPKQVRTDDNDGGGTMIRKLKSGEYRLYSRKKDATTGRRRNLGTFKTRA